MVLLERTCIRRPLDLLKYKNRDYYVKGKVFFSFSINVCEKNETVFVAHGSRVFLKVGSCSSGGSRGFGSVYYSKDGYRSGQSPSGSRIRSVGDTDNYPPDYGLSIELISEGIVPKPV